MHTLPRVELPISRPPVFPDACVLCNRSRSEPLLTLAVGDEQGRVDFYLYGLSGKPAQGTHLQVPVHDTCAKEFRNRFLQRLSLMLLAAAAVTTLGYALHGPTWLNLSLAAITLTLLLYPTLTGPAPFEFWQSRDRWVLVFQDRAYAEHFAHLNHAEVIDGAEDQVGAGRP